MKIVGHSLTYITRMITNLMQRSELERTPLLKTVKYLNCPDTFDSQHCIMF